LIEFRPVVAWLAAIAIVLLRATCRIRRFGDPRPALRSKSQAYAYSVLHAHQVCAIIDGEAGTGAMVSRSADGGLIVPSLRARGIVPVRGSTDDGQTDKGGRTAFLALVAHVRGGAPAYFAVDGPRGPRNHVQSGIALLSLKTGAAVLNIVAVPARRWILSGAWDRMQIPKPFTTINVYFGEPIVPRADEAVEAYRERIEKALSDLERLHDPSEAALAAMNSAPPGGNSEARQATTSDPAV
jgi:lysophospholipid acyltransferase (LPLAT)-like uncharacterized protein